MTGYFVYILRCADGTLYTGWTTDVAARLEAHNRGQGAKYTRGRGPSVLVYQETLPDKTAAMQREYVIKRLSRRGKLALIAGTTQLLP
ncbi:MAG: GIY-YIG nuclease family protein [Oscillospiraceae bacterium]|nr:GIY-YIG nuclease family protein [Oscillospiraceae bacterium]